MKLINLKELFRPTSKLNLAIGEFSLKDCKDLINEVNKTNIDYKINLTDDYKVEQIGSSYIVIFKAMIDNRIDTISFFIADWSTINKPQFTDKNNKYLVYEY